MFPNFAQLCVLPLAAIMMKRQGFYEMGSKVKDTQSKGYTS